MKDLRISIGTYTANVVNEDKAVCCCVTSGPNSIRVWGVFDGHGGGECSTYLKSSIKDHLMAALLKRGVQTLTKKDMRELIVEVFHTLDTNYTTSPHRSHTTGSCALVAFFYRKWVFVANVGDSRALLNGTEKNKSITKALTADQDSSNPTEREKVKKRTTDLNPIRQVNRPTSLFKVTKDGATALLAQSGGARVAGSLMVTRAVGDSYLKNKERSFAPYAEHVPYITAAPIITTHKIRKTDNFLVLASDGLYNFMRNEEITDTISAYLSGASNSQQTQVSCYLIDWMLTHKVAPLVGVSPEVLGSYDPGRRRKYHDDVTVVTVIFTQTPVDNHHHDPQQDTVRRAARMKPWKKHFSHCALGEASIDAFGLPEKTKASCITRSPPRRISPVDESLVDNTMDHTGVVEDSTTTTTSTTTTEKPEHPLSERETEIDSMEVEGRDSHSTVQITKTDSKDAIFPSEDDESSAEDDCKNNEEDDEIFDGEGCSWFNLSLRGQHLSTDTDSTEAASQQHTLQLATTPTCTISITHHPTTPATLSHNKKFLEMDEDQQHQSGKSNKLNVTTNQPTQHTVGVRSGPTSPPLSPLTPPSPRSAAECFPATVNATTTDDVFPSVIPAPTTIRLRSVSSPTNTTWKKSSRSPSKRTMEPPNDVDDRMEDTNQFAFRGTTITSSCRGNPAAPPKPENDTKARQHITSNNTIDRCVSEDLLDSDDPTPPQCNIPQSQHITSPPAPIVTSSPPLSTHISNTTPPTNINNLVTTNIRSGASKESSKQQQKHKGHKTALNPSTAIQNPSTQPAVSNDATNEKLVDVVIPIVHDDTIIQSSQQQGTQMQPSVMLKKSCPNGRSGAAPPRGKRKRKGHNWSQKKKARKTT